MALELGYRSSDPKQVEVQMVATRYRLALHPIFLIRYYRSEPSGGDVQGLPSVFRQFPFL